MNIKPLIPILFLMLLQWVKGVIQPLEMFLNSYWSLISFHFVGFIVYLNLHFLFLCHHNFIFTLLIYFSFSFYILFFSPYFQVSSRKTKLTRCISRRFLLMFFRRFANTSFTKYVTLTAQLRFQNFRSPLKLPWNFWWLLTFWTVNLCSSYPSLIQLLWSNMNLEKTKTKTKQKKKQFPVSFFSFYLLYLHFIASSFSLISFHNYILLINNLGYKS